MFACDGTDPQRAFDDAGERGLFWDKHLKRGDRMESRGQMEKNVCVTLKVTPPSET